MKKAKMPETSILVNTRAWLDDIFTYEDYVEYCECNDYEPADEGSHEFFDWQLEECQRNVECDLDNIKFCSHYKNTPYVITGSLGLWDGRPSIHPVKVTGLYEAIVKCWGNCDDCMVEINNKTGVVSVYAYHHDGTNCFEIRELQERYIDAYEKALDVYEYGCAETFEVKNGWFKKIKNLYWI